MTNKECIFVCPYRFSEEIAGVCPSTGIDDQLDALDLCKQVMFGRRQENELRKGSRLPISQVRDPRIREYRIEEIENIDTDETPELNIRSSSHDPKNPTLPHPKKKKRNRFKDAFLDE